MGAMIKSARADGHSFCSKLKFGLHLFSGNLRLTLKKLDNRWVIVSHSIISS